MSVTREEFLSHVHRPLVSTARPSSPTKSTYRVRWRELSEWDDFVTDAQTYWNNLPATEKSQVLPEMSPDYWDHVAGILRVTAPSISQEPRLANPFTLLYARPHNQAIAQDGNGHALISTALPPETVRQPDGCFVFNDKLAGIIELKGFWNLTEEAILEVLQGYIHLHACSNFCIGAAPSVGDHHGRLAVEQAYGYMFYNSVVYGMITTVNSFAFLRREKDGKLNLTRLIPATRTNPTMLCLLYYFSHLCATTQRLVETHQDGRPITVIRALNDSSIVPIVPPPLSVSQMTLTSSLSHIQLDAPQRSPSFQQGDSLSSSKAPIPEQLCFDIDVTAPGSWMGRKGLLNTGEPVFAKLWDGWKHSSEKADRETAVYNSLRELWGIHVPRLIAHGGWGFCHIVVLEFIKVIPEHSVLLYINCGVQFCQK